MCGNVQTLTREDGQIVDLARGLTVTLRVSNDSTDSGPGRSTGNAISWAASKSRAPLVIGFGNVLLGDDGAGVHLVTRLRSEGVPRVCEFIDGGTMSFSLLSYVEATNSMLVIDAAELDRAPGTIALFEGSAMDDFLKSTRRRTVHEVGLIDLLDMARLEDSLPGQRALLCIQPGTIDWGETLSPAVVEALSRAVDEARELLDRWILA